MTLATDEIIKVFQYWDKDQVPQEVRKVMRSWKNHPNFRVQLYDLKKARRFIKNNFDGRTLRAFNQCRLPAMQADFFRYCALYVHGGVYIDADISLRPDGFSEFQALIQSCECGLIMTREKAIANDIIFIRHAKSPLIKSVLNRAISNIEKRSSNNVWQVTGPGIMTTMYKDTSDINQSLFSPYEVKSYKVMRKIVEFKWKLEYKSGEGHWTEAQKTKSIFKKSKLLNSKPKVFCVGFNKTGTSSLHSYFQHHGLKSMHNLVWQEATHYLGPKRLATFLKQYDAFSDGEMANIERIYELYPDAYYILNVRELDSWVKSRIKWLHRNYPKQVNGPMGQDYRALGDQAIPTWVKRRNVYHNHVKEFFKNNGGKLLTINVCSDPKWVDKVDDYLGIETKGGVGFHNNKQVYTEMSTEKKAYMDDQFAKALSQLDTVNSTRVIDVESLSEQADLYELRVDLKHVVRKRFK